MSVLVVILFGVATAMNIAILKWKLEHGRNSDAALDATVLVTLAWLFSGSITGLATATIASAIISLYLLISPPDKLIKKLSGDENNQKSKKKRKKSRKKHE